MIVIFVLNLNNFLIIQIEITTIQIKMEFIFIILVQKKNL